MNTAAQHHHTDQPVAHIQAQDQAFVFPIREFLRQYGCEVVLNKPVSEVPRYEMCVGSAFYVKSFFETYRGKPEYILAVIYGDDPDDLEILLEKGIKVLLVDAEPLSQDVIRKIFSFYFLSPVKIQDSRKEPILTIKKSTMHKEAQREDDAGRQMNEKKDRARIDSVIQDIFRKNTISTKRKKIYPVYAIIFVILLSFVIPYILYGVSLAMSIGTLAMSGKALLSGNVYWARVWKNAGEPHIIHAESILRVLNVFSLDQLRGYGEDQEKLVAMVKSASHAQSSVLELLEKSSVVANMIFMPDARNASSVVSEVMDLSSEIHRVSQHFALIQAEMDAVLTSPRFPFRFAGVQRLGQKGLEGVREIRTHIQYIQRLCTLYPQIGGFRKKQEYLVLFQNSMELRPTGGFIGSLLQVTFEDGIMRDTRVIDVYTADGQLKGHIDSPFPIREILGQEHWYLRDSNWDPDFTKSGEVASWFFEKEMGVSVDGVIAISLPVLTRLLHVLGPIDLPDYNERITESNFFAKSLLYTQTDFFPGSTQKKDFLGALVSALLLRLTSLDVHAQSQLLQIVTDSLNARDIQFYFPAAFLKALMTQWGWSGAMTITDCTAVLHKEVCIGDGVSIIEANMGMNKSNYFVTREGLIDINIAQDGTITQVTTVSIYNTTPQEIPEGGGTYHTYYRQFVPKDARVSSVRLDGFDVPYRDLAKPEIPNEPAVSIEPSAELFSIGLPFVIEPGQVRTLTIETKRQAVLPQGNIAFQYSIRKQSGVESFPWHVSVRYPDEWSAVTDADVANPGHLEYNTTLTTDARVRILFRNTL